MLFGAIDAYENNELTFRWSIFRAEDVSGEPEIGNDKRPDARPFRRTERI